jgi:SET domain
MMGRPNTSSATRIILNWFLLLQNNIIAQETAAVCKNYLYNGTCVPNNDKSKNLIDLDLPNNFVMENVNKASHEEGNENTECGIYFAKSTIPGAGLGMFAGKFFAKNSLLIPDGDLVIPVVDIETHNTGSWTFLWDEYTWDATSLNMDHEGVVEVNAASPGFGAAANAFLDLTNVEEWSPKHDYAGLTREKDPGAGAITPYHDRINSAKQDITKGQELFVNYGTSWFSTRFDTMGPIPVEGDLPKANIFLQKWNRMYNVYEAKGQGHVLKDLLESLVWKNPFNDTSRELFALPKNWEEIDLARNTSLMNLRLSQATRSLEWLEEFGSCADHLLAGKSTISQAGRGAFARRDVPKGSLVAPFPLIHIPDRKRLEMYNMTENRIGEAIVENRQKPSQYQLLMNYCMGHNESTLLLCPYGIFNMLINHSQKPNVKLTWAPMSRSNHHPSWLNLTIPQLKGIQSSGLAMELIALQNIAEGDEIFLDYGDEWQEAWDQHVAQWKPSTEPYISAESLNADLSSQLRTEFEQINEPYPANVQLKCNDAFTQGIIWKKHYLERTLDQFVKESDGNMIPCELLRYVNFDDGAVLYTALMYDPDVNQKKVPPVKLRNVPREAFSFVDRPYTSDMHLASAFRHDIRIPSALFPEMWRNLKHGLQ